MDCPELDPNLSKHFPNIQVGIVTVIIHNKIMFQNMIETRVWLIDTVYKLSYWNTMSMLKLILLMMYQWLVSVKTHMWGHQGSIDGCIDHHWHSDLKPDICVAIVDENFHCVINNSNTKRKNYSLFLLNAEISCDAHVMNLQHLRYSSI